MSMQGKLTLRNYRCFDWDNPAVLEFGDGFTAFVGSNNSGKSTALRSIYELRSMLQAVSNICRPGNGFRWGCQPLGTSDIAEVANDGDPTRFQFSIELVDFASIKPDGQWHAAEIILEYEVYSQTLSPKRVKMIDSQGNTRQLEENHIKSADRVVSDLIINYPGVAPVDYSAIIAFANELGQSKFFPAFRNAINEGAGSYYDIPVGTALVATWDQWKAGSSRALKLAISRVENEIASLLGFKSLQINADQTGKTLDVNIDGRPQKLHEVGAGVAQLIIVLAAALVNKPPYILIDEPELSLHPALQLSFLTTLGSYATKGLLYSTHSISLARSTAQRIYAVKRIRNGSSQMHPFGDSAINFGGWLGELSYSSRVELGCIPTEGWTSAKCWLPHSN